MSNNFIQSAILRSLALSGYRVYARSQFWRSGPRIFINSIPKAGTHLVTAELGKFASVQNSRLHLEAAKMKVAGERTPTGQPMLNLHKIERAIATVKPGQFFSAHLYWSQGLSDILEGCDVRSLFMVRDPRDILVSRMHYIVGLRRHWMHDFLTTRFSTPEQRYRVLIDGHPADPFVLPMREMLGGFVPWTTMDSVLTIRFEDLVGERGGGSLDAKRAVLAEIAAHCGLPQSDVERHALTGTKTTPTLRSGKTQAWRRELPDAIVQHVHERCGAEMRALGYEFN